jgi:NAD(P)-dependent dehydrogenase (short-subunit alcohol dehydrogenase family)
LDLVRREGGSAFGIRCDISDGAEVRDLVREVTERCASPQILVHSAAIQFNRPFVEVTFEEWRRTQAVNQDSMFHFLQVTLPAMKTAGWGRIVVIASSTFYINTSGLTHYVTSKGALIGLVHGLAGEIGAFGVTINAVAPGLTRTRKAVADVPEAYFQHVTQLQSIPRNGTAEDQAGVVSFLVCDDAAFITGQTILADGGQGRT